MGTEEDVMTASVIENLEKLVSFFSAVVGLLICGFQSVTTAIPFSKEEELAVLATVASIIAEKVTATRVAPHASRIFPCRLHAHSGTRSNALSCLPSLPSPSSSMTSFSPILPYP